MTTIAATEKEKDIIDLLNLQYVFSSDRMNSNILFFRSEFYVYIKREDRYYFYPKSEIC